MAVIYPSLAIAADSVNRITVAGPEAINGLTDPDGVPYTPADTTAFIEVRAVDGQSLVSAVTTGRVLLPRAQMAPFDIDNLGHYDWRYDVPAAVWPTGTSPWLVMVRLFDQTGAGAPRRTFYYQANEQD